MVDSMTMSPAMEDYLEVILELSKKEGLARVTDIAARLNIAKASVSQAVNTLKNMGMVVQDKYGPVELTEKGREYAVKIRNRHCTLKKFLIEVLEVDPKVAEKDACLMEHVVSCQTMARLVNFLESNTELKDSASDSVEGKEDRGMEPVNTRNLSQLAPGAAGRVIRVTAAGSMRRRLMDMGLVSGAEVMVAGKAPMGDPIEVSVKGYRLTLRKKEASEVFVEVLSSEKQQTTP